ncbi:piggyBac transposable element-derived protein 4-like [Belonocnema kinseyi]|uniref:piggyBac transposable element-derived protein 4-like n=1 Tax=Belonocnema kinseyi TaxID=2817044 RepID=UPI00143D4D98|nr:piggyBac transposable element-derived protein 4-like [Belonocnema kinseyi]
MAYNLRSRIDNELMPDDRETFGGEQSEDEGDNVSEQSEFSSKSEPSEDEDLENVTLNQRILEQREQARGRPTTTLRSKNGTKWSTKPRTRVSDRMSTEERNPGPRNGAENCKNVAEFWELLFNQELRNKIVEYTNKQIQHVCAQMMAEGKAMQTFHYETDLVEMNAFIGLLYYSGMWKASHVSIIELWAKENGNTFYHCTMPKNRFEFLASTLRFDVKENRSKNDRFSAIRELWEMFIKNCQHYYEPINTMTVDEQLLSFRGCCLFRIYIKSKPDRYGLKIITLNDAQTYYLVNGIPYLGETGHPKTESSGEFFFRKVTAPIHGRLRAIISLQVFLY